MKDIDLDGKNDTFYVYTLKDRVYELHVPKQKLIELDKTKTKFEPSYLQHRKFVQSRNHFTTQIFQNRFTATNFLNMSHYKSTTSIEVGILGENVDDWKNGLAHAAKWCRDISYVLKAHPSLADVSLVVTHCNTQHLEH